MDFVHKKEYINELRKKTVSLILIAIELKTGRLFTKKDLGIIYIHFKQIA